MIQQEVLCEFWWFDSTTAVKSRRSRPDDAHLGTTFEGHFVGILSSVAIERLHQPQTRDRIQLTKPNVAQNNNSKHQIGCPSSPLLATNVAGQVAASAKLPWCALVFVMLRLQGVQVSSTQIPEEPILWILDDFQGASVWIMF